MATMKSNKFTSWDLSDEEVIEGSMLNDYQVRVLENEQAQTAEEKLEIEFDPGEPELYVQQEAYKRGYLDAISYRLSQSEWATNEIASNIEYPDPGAPSISIDPVSQFQDTQ